MTKNMRQRRSWVVLFVATAAMLATPASTLITAQDAARRGGASLTWLSDGRWLRLGGTDAKGVTDDSAGIVDASGHETLLPWRLTQPRSLHTATVLPDGRVAVIGGYDTVGHLSSIVEIIDPATGAIEIEDGTNLERVDHTATLLLDGSVLVVGGRNSSGNAADSGLWNPGTTAFDSWNVPPGLRRSGHSAVLSSNGEVLIVGGTTAQGTLSTVQRYASSTKSILDGYLNGAASNAVAESHPASGATDVDLDPVIGFRFIGPAKLVDAAINISDDSGLTLAARLVGAEGGRLAFAGREGSLEPGTTYTVTVSGVRDVSGSAIAPFTMAFTTAGQQTSPVPSDDTAPATDTWRSLPPLKAAAGQTALSGQTLRLNGTPLSGVTFSIGAQSTQSDQTGRFILTDLTPGHHVLVIEGKTASTPGAVYGRYEAGVEVLAGRTEVLPYTVWMTKLDTAHSVHIPSPTTAETVVTTSKLPGLEVHIPAGTTIRDADGKIVTEISITQIPVDRPPFSLPSVRVPIYFTIQPGGAYLENASWAPARLIYPNLSRVPNGTSFDFWNYDADGRGWYIYGQGQVVPPGRQIVPNRGVGIYEFTGAMVGDENNYGPPPGPPPPPGPKDPPGPPPPPAPPGPGPSGPDNQQTNHYDGDPVDLATGLFVYHRTDAALADSWPLKLDRYYRPGDSRQRAFGVGATHNYELLLLSANLAGYTEMDLVLPNSSRIHYVRISSGSGYTDAVLEHTSSSTIYYKSQISYVNGGWELKLRNGLVYLFPSAFSASSPQQSALIEMRDRLGNQVIIQRNSNSNVSRIISPHGRSLTFAYDTSQRITSVTDNIGRVVSYAYDSSGRLTTVTDPDSYTTQYTYDASSRMATIEDRRGIVFLTNTYDTAGRIATQTLADSTTYQFSYTVNGGGQITQADVTDPAGFVRRVAFNSAGSITSETRAYGRTEAQTTSYTYNSSNLLTGVTDALGRNTTYVYDSMGNRTSVTYLTGTANAVTTTYTYDSTYQFLTSITDPLSHTTTLGYTSGQLTSMTDALSHVTTVTNNSNDQPLAVTDPLGNTVTMTYENGVGTTKTDPLGNVWTRLVDNAGRSLGTVNPLGRQTTVSYNVMNQLVQQVDPLTNATTYSFNENGHLSSYTDARSHGVSFTYNNMDRVTTQTDALSHSDTYTYTADGWLASHTDRRGQETDFTYDGLGRLTLVTYADTSTVAFVYDAGNRLIEIDDSAYGTITRTFDDLDRLTDETTEQGEVSYTYDAGGRRTSMTVAGQTTITYGYDDASHLTSITQGTTVVAFTYDNAGRHATTTYPNGVLATHLYNSASRVSSITWVNGITTIGDLTYSYDPAGNRTNVGGSLAATIMPTAVSTATYNDANRLTAWGSATLTYDNAGNMTSDGTNSYTWNARNQLSAISSGLSGSFGYDPLGRRARRTVGSTLTMFLYDGLNAVQELDGTGPTANLITGLSADDLYVRTDSSGTRSVARDALGSVIGLLDGSGSLVTQYAYGAFGQVQTVGTSSTNSFQFTGRESDGTTLMYFRARYYSPGLNRFISDDPAGIAGGVNATSYAANNPMTLVDPLGLKEQQDDDDSGPTDDKWFGYGNDENFRDWVHKKIKNPGDPDIPTKQEMDDLHDQFVREGSPKKDPRADWDRTKRQLFSSIPQPTPQQKMVIVFGAGTTLLIIIALSPIGM